MDEAIIKKFAKQASEYYSKLKICPDGDDVVNYICEKVEDEWGLPFGSDDIEMIREILDLEDGDDEADFSDTPLGEEYGGE
jgi:hypothetical protein